MVGGVLNYPKSFNSSGLLFTHCGDNGKIKIWDTSTGVLKQEYIRSSHLNYSCSCLLWVQTSKHSGHKRKKFKSASLASEENLGAVILGTNTGKILLYDVATNTILKDLEGHTAKINHLTWNNETNSLFSCSEDNHIIEWDVIEHKIKSKWKAGKESVKCILALSNGKNLLTASCFIKLWDLEKKQVTKTFTGHSTDIISLVEVPNKDGYFVSAAKGDRVLSVWSLNSSDKKSNQVASLILQDSPSSLHLVNFGTDISTTLLAVTEGGVLQIFKHKFNGNLTKPLKPTTTVSLASESTESKQSHPIEIHSVFPLQNDKVVITYGNLAFLSFEIIVLNEFEQENIVLVRQDKWKIPINEFNSKTKIPIVSNDVDYQVPSVTLKRGVKKKIEVPLEERLENLALVNPQLNEIPKKDNMAQLLLQGLQSKDKNILQSVLFQVEKPVIDVTVKHLPVQALVPLIRELSFLMQGKTFTSKFVVLWLESIIRTHSGILLSNPEVGEVFEPLLALIEARISVLAPLLKLRGRLSMVSEQIQSNLDENVEDLPEPLFTYQEESSDDGDLDKMSEGSGTDSEDNWDEYSEMEDDTDDK